MKDTKSIYVGLNVTEPFLMTLNVSHKQPFKHPFWALLYLWMLVGFHQGGVILGACIVTGTLFGEMVELK